MRLNTVVRCLWSGVVAAFTVGVLFASPARAIDISWGNFANASGWYDHVDIDAAHPDTSYRLFVLTRAVQDIPDVVGYVARLDLTNPFYGCNPLAPLSAFWHFETGGCNEGAISASLTMPAGTTGLTNLWGFGGNGATVFVSYAPDQPVAGHGRLLVQIQRTSPIAVSAGTDYFVFTADLTACMAGACSGADEDEYFSTYAASWWVRGDGSQVYDGPGVYNNVACFNDGCSIVDCWPARPGAALEVPPGAFKPVPDSAGLCGPVAVTAQTWGALKIRYR